MVIDPNDENWNTYIEQRFGKVIPFEKADNVVNISQLVELFTSETRVAFFLKTGAKHYAQIDPGCVTLETLKHLIDENAIMFKESNA